MCVGRHILLGLLTLLCARASHAVPCFPDQWEGTVEVVGASMDASSQYFTQGRSDVAFDFTNARQATNESFQMNGFKYHMSIIMDYAKKIAYEVKDGSCTKTAITQPMSRTCVPDGAVLTGPFTLGIGGQTTPATGYRYNISAGTWVFMYLSPPPVQLQPWVPVAEIKQMGISGATAMSTSSYTNIYLGIRDVSVFDPPPQCQHVPVLRHHEQIFLHPSTSRRVSQASMFNSWL